MKSITPILFLVAYCVGFAASSEPDYTKGETLEGRFNYINLGPIGAYGNVWSRRGSEATRDTRTIQIREVFKGAPAEGKLKEGDVIQGIHSPDLPWGLDTRNNFNDDATRVLSLAITEAERAENGGKLVLKVWRDDERLGEILAVPITLEVMGSFSESTPVACQKTEFLIDKAVASILEKKSLTNGKHRNQITTSLNGLGLLATGDKEHWPIVGAYVKSMNSRDAAYYRTQRTWYLAYQNLLACEYYLATKDPETLPTIEKLSMVIATGRSGIGTWGHGIADPLQNGGELYGMPSGYGAMNQISLTCALSLALAQKCGLKNEAIDTAVEKSANYFRFYVEKGCVPYGDHVPGGVHDNNGSSSQAAVFFNVIGDKEATEFFTMMSLASEKDREFGHCGPFFNRLWGPLGANCGGDYALYVFSKTVNWRNELERRADGGYIYQAAFGFEESGKYTNWETSGTKLLHYCAPRRQLFITGKGAQALEPFSHEKTLEAVAAGRMDPSSASTEELLQQLRNWSPLVRKHATMELGIKRNSEVVDELIAMLSDEDKYARYGAALAMKYAGMQSEEAVDALIIKLHDRSSTMRYFALQGLMVNPRQSKNSLSKVSGKAIPVLVKMIFSDYEDEYRPWTRNYATYTLFGNAGLRDRGPAGRGIITKEEWQIIPLKYRVLAVQKMLELDNGGARSAMSSFYDQLTTEEIAHLMPDLYQSVKKPAPSGVMFNKAGRSNALEILAQNHISEGIELAMDYLFERGHGGYHRRKTGVVAIKDYGAAIPSEFVDKLERAVKPKGGMKKPFEELRNNPMPELVTMKEFMEKTLGTIDE